MEKKILELCAYRKIFDLLEEGPYDENSELFQGLHKLQQKIYELDQYLESTWRTSKRELSKYWKEIKSCLSDLGIRKAKINDYLKYLKKYELHELAMRKGKYPSEFSIEYYYFYKSCDVKLIRQIIYDFIPELKRQYKLSDWRQFDLITEINDDIEDVYEDLDIINGNYFLFLLKQKGKTYCLKAFSDFLDMTVDKATLRYEKLQTKHQKQLLVWSRKYARETKRLLKDRIKHIDMETLELNIA